MNGKFLLDTNIVIAFLIGDESFPRHPLSLSFVGRIVGRTKTVFKVINRFRRRRIYRRLLDSLVSFYGNAPFDHWRDLLSNPCGGQIEFVYPLRDMFPHAQSDDDCNARIVPMWDSTSIDQIRDGPQRPVCLPMFRRR